MHAQILSCINTTCSCLGQAADCPNIVKICENRWAKQKPKLRIINTLYAENYNTHDTQYRKLFPVPSVPHATLCVNSIFRRRFLVRVSCRSGTGFVWYQIPAPIRTPFYFKPETGVHVTEMMIYHRLLFIFVIS